MHRQFTLWIGPLACFALAPAGSSALEPARPNPQMQAVLDELAALTPTPIESLSPAEARKLPTPADAVKSLLKKQGRSTAPEPVGHVEDRSIDGPAGPIHVRIYTPNGQGSSRPVLVYWHGGGWVLEDLDACDASARALCNAAGCLVISADYRRAPEHRFPAATDDALAAYQWALDHVQELGGDPRRIAVGGESAGGNLAAVTALRARDQGLPSPVHQLLVYPITRDNLGTASYRQYAEARPLNRSMMRWFWGHYLTAKPDTTHPYASPLLDPGGETPLPPATIITAEIDPLRNDGQLYANKLMNAGVRVTYENHLGVTHEFFGMGAVLADARMAVAEAATELRRAFEQ